MLKPKKQPQIIISLGDLFPFEILKVWRGLHKAGCSTWRLLWNKNDLIESELLFRAGGISFQEFYQRVLKCFPSADITLDRFEVIWNSGIILDKEKVTALLKTLEAENVQIQLCSGSNATHVNHIKSWCQEKNIKFDYPIFLLKDSLEKHFERTGAEVPDNWNGLKSIKVQTPNQRVIKENQRLGLSSYLLYRNPEPVYWQDIAVGPIIKQVENMHAQNLERSSPGAYLLPYDAPLTPCKLIYILNKAQTELPSKSYEAKPIITTQSIRRPGFVTPPEPQYENINELNINAVKGGLSNSI